MQLTDKCLKAFNDYYHQEYVHYSDHNKVIRELSKLDFWELPPEFKEGVIKGFFRSVGIYLGCEPLYDMSGTFRISIDEENGNHGIQSKDRNIARDKAIEKANDIFNKR